MASCKMKQIRKNGGCKETEELNNEDNEELFADIGLCSLKIWWMKSICVVAFLSKMCSKDIFTKSQTILDYLLLEDKISS